MADDQTATMDAEQKDEFEYEVRIESAGPASKKVTVEIPSERISEKLEEQYKELRRHAAVPGFRVGHAPRKLIEKKFSNDVKEQVRSTLIRESYEQAVEKNKLQVIGEPEFDNPEAIKLPESGALSYSFQVEVQPEFELPDFSKLTVQKPKVTITEENVEQAMKNLREQQGTLVPIEDRGVQDGDYLTADVHLKVGDEVVAHQHDAQVVSRAGRVAGLQIDDLPKVLAGAKVDETRTVTLHAPGSHSDEKLRGKDVQVEFTVKDIKHLELAEINQAFLEDLGFENENELRDALREQMEEKINDDIQTAMRTQVNNFLLQNVQMDLPSKLSDRQAERVISRRAVDLMLRGMPREQVEGNIERLREGAHDSAIRDLKLFFILQKVANDAKVDVSEAELNGQIAMLAAQRDMRPEKLKQQLSKDNSLMNLYVQMREQKAIDKVLEQAKIEEKEIAADDSAQAGAGNEGA